MDTQTFSVRVAHASDAEIIASVGAETFYDTFVDDNTPEDMAAYLAKSFGPEIQGRELADPNSLFLLIECGDDVVGYARLVWGEAPACVVGTRPMDLNRLYIRRPWIGRGAAALLMHRCLDEARRRQSDVVWLGVWEHNHRARAFYRKFGFMDVGSHVFVLGTDVQTDLVMVLAM